MQHARGLHVCVKMSVLGCFAFCTGTNGDVTPANVDGTAGSVWDPEVQENR